MILKVGLIMHAHCSKSNFIIALALIDKMQFLNHQFRINRKNIFKTLITALLIAIKVYDDIYYQNTRYGVLGGISLPHLNFL